MEFLEYYREMKDTVKEIEDLDKKVSDDCGRYSRIVVDLFDKITTDIFNNEFSAGSTLYDVENLLEVFSLEKVKDIEILEQLRDKLNRLTRVTL